MLFTLSARHSQTFFPLAEPCSRGTQSRASTRRRRCRTSTRRSAQTRLALPHSVLFLLFRRTARCPDSSPKCRMVFYEKRTGEDKSTLYELDAHLAHVFTHLHPLMPSLHRRVHVSRSCTRPMFYAVSASRTYLMETCSGHARRSGLSILSCPNPPPIVKSPRPGSRCKQQ